MPWRSKVIKLARRFEVQSYVEIGVRKGELTTMMFERISSLTDAYLVDPWSKEFLDRRGEARTSAKKRIFAPEAQEKTDQIYYGACRRIAKAAHKYQVQASVLRMTSMEAVKCVPDSSVDMVFIDGFHTYEAVVEDIREWKPKLKDGGILVGDDFNRHYPGVVKAVQEEGGFEHIKCDKRNPRRIWWKICTK